MGEDREKRGDEAGDDWVSHGRERLAADGARLPLGGPAGKPDRRVMQGIAGDPEREKKSRRGTSI
jgi:hypothetical protein